MKDHEKRELVDALTKVAIEFGGTQQLRERIAQLVLPALAAQVAEIAALKARINLIELCSNTAALDDLRKDAERYRRIRNGRVVSHIRSRCWLCARRLQSSTTSPATLSFSTTCTTQPSRRLLQSKTPACAMNTGATSY